MDLRTFPSLDLTEFDLAAIEERLRHMVRDTAYVGIGLSVLAVQKAMVRRRELLAGRSRQAK